ncbi:MAG: hypothetical protein JO317_01810 [Verrucomicrobiae bacterium]|nr:hypothetical protein [Verrucomicrobiae bacterium]
MKKVLLTLLLTAFSLPLFANCGGDHEHCAMHKHKGNGDAAKCDMAHKDKAQCKMDGDKKCSMHKHHRHHRHHGHGMDMSANCCHDMGSKSASPYTSKSQLGANGGGCPMAKGTCPMAHCKMH